MFILLKNNLISFFFQVSHAQFLSGKDSMTLNFIGNKSGNFDS